MRQHRGLLHHNLGKKGHDLAAARIDVPEQRFFEIPPLAEVDELYFVNAGLKPHQSPEQKCATWLDLAGRWGAVGGLYRSDIAAMQRSLEALGQDVGGADGLAGFKTRRSIGRWQEVSGQTATCFPESEHESGALPLIFLICKRVLPGAPRLSLNAVSGGVKACQWGNPILLRHSDISTATFLLVQLHKRRNRLG